MKKPAILSVSLASIMAISIFGGSFLSAFADVEQGEDFVAVSESVTNPDNSEGEVSFVATDPSEEESTTDTSEDTDPDPDVSENPSESEPESSEDSDGENTAALSAPQRVHVWRINEDEFMISWHPVEGAEKYEVYETNDSDWNLWSSFNDAVLIGETTRTNYRYKKGNDEEFYHNFTIKAVGPGGKSEFSLPNEDDNIVGSSPRISFNWIPVQASHEVTAEPAGNTVKLTWTITKENASPTGYLIYRADSADGDYHWVGSTIGTPGYNQETLTSTYEDEVSAGTYYYKIATVCDGMVGLTNEVPAKAVVTGEDPDNTKDKPEAPANLKALAGTEQGSASLSWDAVEGVDGYHLYRSKDAQGVYERITTVPASGDRVYTDTGLENDTAYYYVVRAYIQDVESENSNTASITLQVAGKPEPVKRLTAQALSTTSVELTWDAVDGADGYYIRVYDENNTDLNISATLDKDTLKAVVDGLEPNTAYIFHIAVISVDFLSEHTAATARTMADETSLPAPQEFTYGPSDLGEEYVTFSWKSVEGAEEYRLYRSDKESGDYTLVSSTTSLSVPDHSLGTGNYNWYYVVRAYNEKGESPSSNILHFEREGSDKLSAPAQITAEAGAERGTISLTWSAVENAEGYQLFRCQTESGEYEQIAELSETNYLDKDLGDDATWYYVVRAYRQDQFSEHSDIANATTLPEDKEPEIQVPAPFVKVKKGEGNSAELSWEAVDNATGYHVYRGESPDSLVIIHKGDGEMLSYVDAGLNPETTYYYALEAAMDELVSGMGEVVSFKLEQSMPFPKIEATALSSTSIQLEATVDGNREPDGYRFYRSTSLEGTYTLISGDVDTGLSSNQFYYYKAEAYWGDQVSERSEAVRVRTLQPLARPSGVQTRVDGAYQITLGWNAVDMAEGYDVYRATGRSGDYTKIATIDDGDTSYIDDDVSSGTTYYYKVTAFNDEETSPDSMIRSATTKAFSAPTGITVTSQNSHSAQLKWQAVPSADEYIILRATSRNGNYEEIDVTDKLSYTDEGLDAYTIYYYKICASNEVENSAASRPYSVRTHRLYAPSGLTAQGASDSSIRVFWQSVGDADSYNLYYSTSRNGEYALAGSTEGLTLSVEDLEPATRYYFKAESVNEYGKSSYSSVTTAKTWNNAQSITLRAPSGLSAKATSPSEIQIRWRAVEGAEGYKVYRSGTRTGTFELIGETDEIVFVDTELAESTTYYYKVEAFGDDQVKTSAPFSAMTKRFEAPAGLSLYQAVDSLTISWRPADLAESYTVYRSTERNGTYEPLDTVEDTYFQDDTVEPRTRYYYKVTSQSALYGESAAAGPISGRAGRPFYHSIWDYIFSRY